MAEMHHKTGLDFVVRIWLSCLPVVDDGPVYYKFGRALGLLHSKRENLLPLHLPTPTCSTEGNFHPHHSNTSLLPLSDINLNHRHIKSIQLKLRSTDTIIF